MKTIVEDATNLSKYLFEDSKPVTMEAGRITVGDTSAPDFYIGDLTSETATLYENVTDSPADWAGNKYTYDPDADPAWAQDSNWVDPNA